MSIEKVRQAIKSAKLGFRPSRVFVVYAEKVQEFIDVSTWSDFASGSRQYEVGLVGPSIWRWCLISPATGRTVGVSPDSFDSQRKAICAARLEASYYVRNKVALVTLE